MALSAAALLVCPRVPAESIPLAGIAIDYPAPDALFPPDFASPTFLWRDSSGRARVWRIEVKFADGAVPIHVRSAGEPLRVGEIDPTCVSDLNEPPKLTPAEAAAHTWKPDATVWALITKHSAGQPATLTITGFADEGGGEAVSRGESKIATSKDPVGAPIFFRDVPLIPGVGEHGVIRPLPQSALQLIKWRLRWVGESQSRTLMTGLHTCANCHSFSGSGETMGMDVDGPQNDKGLYSLTPVQPETIIRRENVIQWSAFRPLENSVNIRVGFMSQVSPDGRHVVTMINDPGPNQTGPGLRPQERVYVANFKDYHFGQVFFPTKGILAVYDREARTLRPLPGASDPNYVQTGAFWSPDGKYLVFSRARAKEPFPEGYVPPQFANDPNETQIQYDLYRIPFNNGAGGVAEPIEGASNNGMSNNFAKVSPDGKWIVFVECRNGQLMRPDSRLFIVPFQGGQARLMKCNTPLMNSWHSFSPNGRWMVFASKGRSPYTQMYLTHIDADGNDTPPLLIENATAANRAVNIPEFVDIAPGGLVSLYAPVADFYRVFDEAMDMAHKQQYQDAVAKWREAVKLDPDDARAHFQLGFALSQLGQRDEGIAEYRESARLEPRNAATWSNLAIAVQAKGLLDEAIEDYRRSLEIDARNARAHTNLAVALLQAGRVEEGVEHCRRALEIDPKDGDAHNALAIVLARQGSLDEAITQLEQAVAGNPDSPDYRFNLGRVLAAAHRFSDAIPHLERAATLTHYEEPVILDLLAAMQGEVGRYKEAAGTARQALAQAQRRNDRELVDELTARVAFYEAQASK
jgi:Flp pilus assembly protein TadD